MKCLHVSNLFPAAQETNFFCFCFSVGSHHLRFSFPGVSWADLNTPAFPFSPIPFWLLYPPCVLFLCISLFTSIFSNLSGAVCLWNHVKLLWSGQCLSDRCLTLILTCCCARTNMKVGTTDIHTLFHSFLSLPIFSSEFLRLQKSLTQDGSNVHVCPPWN